MDKGDAATHPVYAWEDMWAYWHAELLTLEGCRRLIRKACRHYSVNKPVVRSHSNKLGYSWCRPTTNTISMQTAGKNPATCLHEAAHHIAYAKYGTRIHDHGPTFLGIYMWLLEKENVAPRIALHATARKHKLRWRNLPPEALK